MAIPLTVRGVIDDYIPARWSYATRWGNPIMYFGLHVPVMDETMDGAENLGRYFARTDRKASTHFGTDPTGTIRYLPDGHTAYAAKGINSKGLHVEMMGDIQTRREWKDDYSRAVLEETAKLWLLVHEEYGIPRRILSTRELARGTRKGIVFHSTAYKVFGGSVRTDPGDAFPSKLFLELCEEQLDSHKSSPIERSVFQWKREFNRANPRQFSDVVEFVQLGLRSLADPDTGEPYYGEWWRIDGLRGPVTRAAWRNFERDVKTRYPERADAKAGNITWNLFLEAIGLTTDDLARRIPKS